jgi:glycerol-3-phosphate acyltransferase PlsY
MPAMNSISKTRRYGLWLMALAGLIGAALTAYQYFTPGTGIDRAGGTMLVLVSCVLILLASLLLFAAPSLPGWITGLFTVLLFLGVIGTGVAAYFLETEILLALMAAAFIGWLMAVFSPRREALPELSAQA